MKNIAPGLVLIFLVAACSPTTTSPSAVTPTPSPETAGPLPVLVDTDLAGDDLLALMGLLREPSVDVRAIAVDGNGEVHCPAGVTNVRDLLRAFELEAIPVGCGRETPGEHGRLFPDAWRAGADAFYGVKLRAASGAVRVDPAAELIAKTAAASSEPLTIVALGPWSNIADAVAANSELPAQIARIYAMAGAVDVPGNIALGEVTYEHGVEWNVGVDPDAFAAVLDTRVPITLVPLDATNDVPVPPDFASILEADHAAAGADIAFEMFSRSPELTSGTSFWDTLAAMALVDPGLVTWEDLTVTVERDGLSAGRIHRTGDGRRIRAAMSADPAAFRATLLASLRRGAPRPEPFDLGGTLEVTWDGAACQFEPSRGLVAGVVRLVVANESDAPVTVFLAGVEAPRRWADVIAFSESVDFANLGPPDWIIQIDASATPLAGAQAVAIASIPTAEVGAICITGEWPDVELALSDSVVVPG